MHLFVKRFLGNERGATMVEYGLLVTLIALVVAVGAGAIGRDINGFFDSLGTYLGTLTPIA
jgi:pilus assembly protein Flp/PilA